MSDFTIKGLWQVLKQAAGGFSKDKVPKLSASLAYYTIFSLGPMLIVILFVVNMVWRREALEGRIFGEIKELVGDSAALQIQEIIRNAAINGNNTLNAIIGIVTLIIAATGVFAEIQDSINSIWNLKVKTEKGWLLMLKSRLLSFSLVVTLGFLLLVSLVINGLVEGFMDRLQRFFPQITVVLVYIINLVITLLVTSSLFAIIFKMLPDAIIRWRDVVAGSIFTAVLFMVGKFGITLYISKSDIDTAYGTAGSLVILLLWVYYSSIILYFGAEFTKFYALKFGATIKPDKYAVIVQTVQVESHKESIQENENDLEKTERELQKAKDKIDKGESISS